MHSAWTGLAGGIALGLFEASLIAVMRPHPAERLYDMALVPLAAVLAFALAGALVGALLRPSPSTWWLLAALSVAGVLYTRWSEPLLLRWYAVPIAIVVGLVAAWLLRRIPTKAGARIVPLAIVVAIGLPIVAALAGDRLDPPSVVSRRPQRPAPPADSPSVCLVTWDTVRADTLPAFGGGGLDTPELDRMLREGVLFDRFQAVASTTAPAHLSMLTGLYPDRHGLRSNGDVAPVIDLPRLQELFGDAGYATGAFVSNYVLRAQFGFDLGFDTFDTGEPGPWKRVFARLGAGSSLIWHLEPDEFVIDAVNAPGRQTVERTLAWLAHVDRPAFLWVHFYDAHYPYRPAEPQRSRALARAGEGPHAVDPETEEGLVLQRGEIEELDELLGALRRGLEAHDPGLARTWILLAADHGECFGEGGIRQGHHKSLFRATQHIIGAIRPPSSLADFPRGTRVSAPASQVDLYPTICALTGRATPPGVQGLDLVPIIRGGAPSSRGLYMETFQVSLGEQRMHGWWEDGWKYVRRLDGSEMVLEDGVEREVDRTATAGERTAMLRARLDEYLKGSHATNAAQPLDENALKALKQLGYTGDDH